MDKVPKLGRVIEGDEPRDAVHIAVAPVIAAESLKPGTRIGFVDADQSYTVSKKAKLHVGIVDPFLINQVEKGDKFYMFLFPNTITSLHHMWSHPAFEQEDKFAKSERTFLKLQGTVEEERRVAEMADQLGTTYDELMDAADRYVEWGEYFVKGGEFEGVSLPDAFWADYEAIRHVTVKDADKHSFLSCSC